MRYILSIRGGGIRGIIPTCCLMKLESQLGGITRDHIAYCAGTSTGALLTAAIAAGIPAASWVVNDCPIGVMISATAMNGHNWFFVKDNPQNARTTGSVKLVDAAVASACAPTYFDHWRIDNINGQTIRFFDGG